MDNPLENNPSREHRVRERAYHLWEADGKPYGRDVEYWERARELIAIEDSAGAGLVPNPQSHPESVRETGVEEAEIQQNLGEFPDRFADQGEVQPTPAAVHSPRRRAAAAAATSTPPAAPGKGPAASAKAPAKSGKGTATKDKKAR